MKRSCRGTTLVELLIALGILALAIAAGHAALRAGSLRYRQIRRETEVSARRDRALAHLARDLRCAYLTSEETETFFVGRRDFPPESSRLHFYRAAPSEGRDIEEVEYRLEREAPAGAYLLSRRTKEAKRVLCEKVARFQVRYFDGEAWREEWGWDGREQRPTRGIRGLPLLVAVELVLEGEDAVSAERKTVFPVMTVLLNKSIHG